MNVIVADASKKLWAGRSKSLFRKLLALAAASHVIANAAFSVFMVVVSSQNYPGKKEALHSPLVATLAPSTVVG